MMCAVHIVVLGIQEALPQIAAAISLHPGKVYLCLTYSSLLSIGTCTPGQPFLGFDESVLTRCRGLARQLAGFTRSWNFVINRTSSTRYLCQKALLRRKSATRP